MRITRAAAGSLVFFLLAPGIVAGVVPWWLTGWRLRDPGSWWWPLRLLGAVFVVVGTATLVHAFVRFVTEGRGTPAPPAPTEALVVGGLYRYVRNPMYVAVVATVWGQALVLAQPILVGYGAALLVAFVAFVRGYEEPALRRQFGARYDTYRRAVPGWRPRLRPWSPYDASHTDPG